MFLYDGDCGFCTACVRVLERWVPTSAEVIPWQRADLAALGVDVAAAEAAVQWVGRDCSIASGPSAIARFLVDSSSGWRPVGRLLDLPPVSRLAWPVYRLVARNRHRLPGSTAACDSAGSRT